MECCASIGQGGCGGIELGWYGGGGQGWHGGIGARCALVQLCACKAHAEAAQSWCALAMFRADCSRRYEGDAADLGLDFTVDEEAFGARRVTELLPGGADTPVVDANKLLYVHLAADWHLNGRLGAAAAAFANSFHQASRGQHGGV